MEDKIINKINKSTSENSWISALLRLFSFIISAILSVIVIYVKDENFYNAFLIFLIPILFDLGINASDIFRNKNKNYVPFIVMVALFVIYLLLAGTAILGTNDVADITIFLTKHRKLFTLFVFAYSYIYTIEFIMLMVKAVLLKKLHRENELIVT